MRALNAPIHKGNAFQALLLGSLVFAMAYGLTNHFHLFTPRYLPLSVIDRAVPLIPWTIFIYESEYVYFWLAYFLMRQDITRNRALWSFFYVTVVSVIFFVFIPTTFPRHDYYPLPADTHPAILMAFRVLHALDDPSNSFPSMHVSACFATAFSFWHESKRKFAVFTLWSVAIFFSTMSTKQHYFIDALAGFALAMVSAWIFVIKARYKGPGARPGR